jgi:hypothetical protein
VLLTYAVIGSISSRQWKPARLAPIQELTNGMIVSDLRVLVVDGNGKKFEVSLGRFRGDIGVERWNLEGSGFDEA